MTQDDLPAENLGLRTGVTPIGSSAPPLKRRTLFFACIADLVFCCILTLPLAFVAIIIDTAANAVPGRLERQDLWWFDAMAADDRALLAWSKTQSDLASFRVQRIETKNELVLRYARNGWKGPAHPDWDSLGYRMAYLVSASPLPSRTASPPPANMAIFMVPSILIMGGVAFFRIRAACKSGSVLIRVTDRPAHGWLRLSLLAFLVLEVFVVSQEWLLRTLHLAAQDPFSKLLSELRGWPWLIVAASGVLLAPVAEELLFRGCMFGRFRRHGYVASGAVISALLFSLAHGVWPLLPAYFGVGLMLAWLYHRTGSLWPSIAVHFLNNVVAVAIMQ
jgi:membrane protease YdiL (CAAX protease family)